MIELFKKFRVNLYYKKTLIVLTQKNLFIFYTKYMNYIRCNKLLQKIINLHIKINYIIIKF